MSTINVALLQMSSCGTDQEANLAKGDAFCRRANEMGADIALFPEVWNIGYASFVGAQGGPSDLWRAPHRWGSAGDPIPQRRRGHAPAGRSGPSVGMTLL
jgi:predicted amidohydrolase